MPPTFNFLAGNQEAEENKALKGSLVSRQRGAPFLGRTYRANGPRNSQVLQRWPKLERLGRNVNKQTRSAEVHVRLPKRSSKQRSRPKGE
jgi:hypothetical protein